MITGVHATEEWKKEGKHEFYKKNYQEVDKYNKSYDVICGF